MIDPRNNQVRYIGQTEKIVEERLEGHLKNCRNCWDPNLHKCRWIKQLIDKNLQPIIKVLLTDIPEDKVDNLEIELIKHYKQFSDLTNITAGGKGFKKKHSPETIKLLTEIRKKPGHVRKCKVIIITNIITGEVKEHPNSIIASEVIGITRDHLLRNCEYNKVRRCVVGKTYICEYKAKLDSINNK